MILLCESLSSLCRSKFDHFFANSSTLLEGRILPVSGKMVEFARIMSCFATVMKYEVSEMLIFACIDG